MAASGADSGDRIVIKTTIKSKMFKRKSICKCDVEKNLAA